MKTILYALFATLFFTFNSQAQKAPANQPRTESAFIKMTQGKEVTTLRYKSVKEFESNSDKIFETLQNGGPGGNSTQADACSVTVELSITVNLAVGSATVSGSVTAPCADIKAAVAKLKRQLIAIATDI